MGSYSHRMHVLLDEDRRRLLEDLAASRGSSVGALIREAIDIAFGASSAARRRAAIERLMDLPQPAGAMPDWHEIRAELDDARANRTQ